MREACTDPLTAPGCSAKLPACSEPFGDACNLGCNVPYFQGVGVVSDSLATVGFGGQACSLQTRAVRLDGASWLQIDNHPDFQASDAAGHQSFTVEQWIRPDDVSTHAVTFQDYGQSGTGLQSPWAQGVH